MFYPHAHNKGNQPRFWCSSKKHLLRSMKAGFALIMLFCGLCKVPANAQELLIGPSMSLEDASSQFANPALVSFQRSKLALGAKAYHLGVSSASGVPLRQGYVLYSTPFSFSDMIGMGAHAQYFDSPIFRRLAIGGSVSARVLQFLSVGLRVEALNFSYNQSEFVGFDPADPVFANGFGKTVLTTSLGVFAQPLPNMRLSAGLRNINRPDISLAGDGFRQDLESYLGIGYGVGPAMALFEVIDTFYGVETRFGLEASNTAGSFIRMSSNSEFDLGRVEGQLHVGGPISVSYGYELPLGDLGPSSNGSHTFSVVFDFGRVPELPDPVNIPSYVNSNTLPEITPQIEPKVYISASTDYVRFYEQQIVRKVDEDVPLEALQQLTKQDLGVLDSTFVQNQSQIPGEIVDDISAEVTLQGTYSPNYEASIRELGKALASDSLKDLTITGPGSQLMKAAGVKNRLVKSESVPGDQIVITVPRNEEEERRLISRSSIMPQESRVLYDPANTQLFFNSSYLLDKVQSWEMQIVDMEGIVIKNFTGNETLPASLTWDWRGNDGELIAPGVYKYGLTWVDALGVTHQSNHRKLYVQKLLRKTTIEVTRDIEAIRREADAVEIRIQH